MSMLDFLKDRKSKKFMTDLEDLSYANIKIINEKTGKYIVLNEEYKEYKSNIQDIESDLNMLYKKLDKGEYEKHRIDRQISWIENDIENKKSKEGFLEGIIHWRKYRDKNKRIKAMKARKKMISKETKFLYKQINDKHKQLNNAKKEFRGFEKYVINLAKKYSDEIKFVKYYEKNNEKLKEAYGENQMEEIEAYIQRIVNGEQGFENMSVKECMQQLKKAVKIVGHKHDKKNKHNKKLKFGPKEEFYDEDEMEVEIIDPEDVKVIIEEEKDKSEEDKSTEKQPTKEPVIIDVDAVEVEEENEERNSKENIVNNKETKDNKEEKVISYRKFQKKQFEKQLRNGVDLERMHKINKRIREIQSEQKEKQNNEKEQEAGKEI